MIGDFLLCKRNRKELQYHVEDEPEPTVSAKEYLSAMVQNTETDISPPAKPGR